MSETKKEKAEKPAANIQYVGKRQKLNKEKNKFVVVAKEAPAFIIDGPDKIKLPKGIEKGVYVKPEIADRLFTLRPNDFKKPVLKNGKSKVEVTK
jgi:hypothetical protein